LALLTATFSGNCPVYVAQAPDPIDPMAENEFALLPSGKLADSALATLSQRLYRVHVEKLITVLLPLPKTNVVHLNPPSAAASWTVQSRFKVSRGAAKNSPAAKTSPFLLAVAVVRPDLMIALLI